jgi:hypothetical protein
MRRLFKSATRRSCPALSQVTHARRRHLQCRLLDGQTAGAAREPSSPSHPPQTIERCVLDRWQHLCAFGKTALEPQLAQRPGPTRDLAQPVSQMSAGSRLRTLQPYFRSMCSFSADCCYAVGRSTRKNLAFQGPFSHGVTADTWSKNGRSPQYSGRTRRLSRWDDAVTSPINTLLVYTPHNVTPLIVDFQL